jgi:hypothetical protein
LEAGDQGGGKVVVRYKFKRGFATGCFGHRVFLVTHDAVKYSNEH